MKLIENLKHLSTFAVYTVVLVVVSFSSLIFIPPQRAEAGSVQLQGVLDEMNSKCKNMNKDSSTWEDCEKLQGKLVASAGCSGRMFEKTNGKWNVNPQNSASCQTKVSDSAEIAKRHQDLLNFIKDKCSDVTDQRGAGSFLTEVGSLSLIDTQGTWGNCEGMQGVLKNIGCGNLFEQTGGGILTKKWSWKQDSVDACQKVIDGVKSGQPTKAGEGAAAAGGDESTEIDNCNANITDIGWIVCPLIKAGLSLTDTMFKDFVEPLLVNVPISITNGNGTYEAWKQFRVLGNILLIGTLLAVVYAQARSDQ